MRSLVVLTCLALASSPGCSPSGPGSNDDPGKRNVRVAGTDPGDKAEPDAPHIRGTVVSVAVPDPAPGSDAQGLVEVKGHKEPDTRYDWALVSVRGRTKLQKKDGTGLKD